MSELVKKRIIDMLVNATPDKPVTIKQVAQELGMYNHKDTTHWAIRHKYIKGIMADGFPVGSCERGYFMMNCLDDWRVANKYLNDKIVGLERRKKALNRVYREYWL